MVEEKPEEVRTFCVDHDVEGVKGEEFDGDDVDGGLIEPDKTVGSESGRPIKLLETDIVGSGVANESVGREAENGVDDGSVRPPSPAESGVVDAEDGARLLGPGEDDGMDMGLSDGTLDKEVLGMGSDAVDKEEVGTVIFGHDAAAAPPIRIWVQLLYGADWKAAYMFPPQE